MDGLGMNLDPSPPVPKDISKSHPRGCSPPPSVDLLRGLTFDNSTIRVSLILWLGCITNREIDKTMGDAMEQWSCEVVI